MAFESSVRVGSGVSVLREGLVPGFPTALPGMRGSNAVVINYEDINSSVGTIQTSGLTVVGDAVHITGPATRLRGRRQLKIQNLGAHTGAGESDVFIGGNSSVTTSNGLAIPSGTTLTLNVLDVGNIFIISAGASDVRILELK